MLLVSDNNIGDIGKNQSTQNSKMNSACFISVVETRKIIYHRNGYATVHSTNYFFRFLSTAIITPAAAKIAAPIAIGIIAFGEVSGEFELLSDVTAPEESASDDGSSGDETGGFL